jgi:hypothetical protein
MGAVPRSRSSPVRECLKTAEGLIEILGQVHLDTRRPSPTDLHHLPSQGSLIPSAESEVSKRNHSPTYAAEQLGPENPLMQNLGTPRVASAGSPPGQLYPMAWNGGFVPWDPFDLDLNSYYNAEIGELGPA